jgi:tRNA pseudouridine55 synthase
VHGILLIDKPSGWTSFDVVAKIRGHASRAVGHKVKVGHAGTLDPLATGLMVVLVGKEFTKRAEEFSKLDKVYDVIMKLGLTSETGDEEGEKTIVSTEQPSEEVVNAAIIQFTGEIMQRPHAYSAIKVGGKKSYDLARAGKAVELEPRPVTIHSISDVVYEYPLVHFTAHVSSGTYIRSLVEDIGKHLQVGAYMTSLRRTKVGDFLLSDAQQIEEITKKG